MKISSLGMVLASLMLTSCATLPSSKTLISGDEVSVLRMADFPSERRGAWILRDERTGKFTICSEPFSDTGLSTQQLVKLTGDIAKKGNLGFDNTTISTLSELKGRTPSVLALRDVMYRMCERRISSGDGDIPKQEMDLYTSIVNIIGSFAEADRNDARTEQIRSAGREVSVLKARKLQAEGFDALGACSWDIAEAAFAEAEKALPSFQISYEMANALRLAKAPKDKRDAALAKGKGYMPASVKKSLQNCGG